MKAIKNFIKTLLTFILVVALILGLWYFGTIFYHRMTYERPDYLGENSGVIKEEIRGEDLDQGNEIRPKVNGELLFLLAGLDQNAGKSGSHTRSDTLQLYRVNFKEGQVSLISIPRDSRVYVNGSLDKINHASSYGGVELTLKTIRDWLDIDLDYYIKFNFETTMEFVDVLGGVDIDVPQVIADGTSLEAGPQRLNGKEALEYVRFRKGYITGDYGRVQAQQDFMTALFKEVLKPRNIFKLPVLMDIFYQDGDTNIPKSYVVSKLIYVPKMSPEKFDKHIIPGDGMTIDGVSYYVWFEEETYQLRDQILSPYRR